MKRTTGKTKIIMSILLIAALAVTAVPIHSLAKGKAKLSKTKLTLYVGKTDTLKLKNNKKRVKWSSSNKKVVKVSAKGKVKGLKKGKATITAKVGKKKYQCKVTVKVRKEAEASRKPVPGPTVAATGNPTARPTEIPIASPDTTPTAKPTQKPTKTPVPKLESISFEKEEIEAIPGKNTIAELIPYPRVNADIGDGGGYHITWECDSEYVKIENWWTSGTFLKVRIEPQAGFVGTATITAKVLDLVASIRVNVPEVGAELKLSEDGTKVLECPNDVYATYIDLPDTVTTLGKGCFEHCYQIKTWEIPSSVTTIEEDALSYKLESIYIPPSVTFIGDQFLLGVKIYGEAGSYAEQWAEKQLYNFIPR